MKITKAEFEEQKTNLLNWLKPGDTVYTILRHVSKSGMQREISLAVAKHNQHTKGIYFIHPNYAASRVLGLSQGKKDGLIIKGCGIDMGYHIVDNLSQVLGFELRQEWL